MMRRKLLRASETIHVISTIQVLKRGNFTTKQFPSERIICKSTRGYLALRVSGAIGENKSLEPRFLIRLENVQTEWSKTLIKQGSVCTRKRPCMRPINSGPKTNRVAMPKERTASMDTKVHSPGVSIAPETPPLALSLLRVDHALSLHGWVLPAEA
jgi:hypothetical protein